MKEIFSKENLNGKIPTEEEEILNSVTGNKNILVFMAY